MRGTVGRLRVVSLRLPPAGWSIDARAVRGRTTIAGCSGCLGTQEPSPSAGCCTGSYAGGGVQSEERAASAWTRGWKEGCAD